MSLVRKLYLKALWFKNTYTFLWAHKPLCTRFREDVIRLRTVHLCRSCLFAYFGILTSILIPFVLPPAYLHHCNTLLIALVVLTLPLSYPYLYKRLPRRLRDGVRFSLGFILPLIVYTFLEGHFFMPFTILTISFAFYILYFKQRSRRKLQVCNSCEEHSPDAICSGFQYQAKCIRRYEEQATDYLLHTGYMPDKLS